MYVLVNRRLLIALYIVVYVVLAKNNRWPIQVTWKGITLLMEYKDWIHLKTIRVISCYQVHIKIMLSSVYAMNIYSTFYAS